MCVGPQGNSSLFINRTVGLAHYLAHQKAFSAHNSISLNQVCLTTFTATRQHRAKKWPTSTVEPAVRDSTQLQLPDYLRQSSEPTGTCEPWQNYCTSHTFLILVAYTTFSCDALHCKIRSVEKAFKNRLSATNYLGKGVFGQKGSNFCKIHNSNMRANIVVWWKS